jgi:hypothetical protein
MNSVTNTSCAYYGSEPEVYRQRLGDLGCSADQVDLCVDEYNLLCNSWPVLLNWLDNHPATGSAMIVIPVLTEWRAGN